MTTLLDHEYERIVCGTFHPDPSVHRRCNVLAGVPERDADAHDDTGCGASIPWPVAYRCLDCGRFFHAICLAQHFRKNAEPPY